MDILRQIGVERWQTRATNSATQKPLSDPIQSLPIADQPANSGIDNSERSESLSPKRPESNEKLSQDSWQDLQKILDDRRTCPSCARVRPIMGEGDIESDWMFVIDAPTERDSNARRLLNGRVGQLFEAILQSIRKNRESIYLTSIFKCPPSADLGFAAICGNLIHKQIALVKPKVIVTLGEFAAQSILRSNDDLAQLRTQESHQLSNQLEVICSYSLDQVLTDPTLKADVWRDLKFSLKTIAAG